MNSGSFSANLPRGMREKENAVPDSNPPRDAALLEGPSCNRAQAAARIEQSAPVCCPRCRLANPRLVSSFAGSLNETSRREDSKVTVYKCECGYLFAVANVESEKGPTTPNPADIDAACPNQ